MPHPTEIRWVDADLQKLSLVPGDILVLMAPGKLSEREIDAIQADCAAYLPGHKVLVLEDGMRLGAIRPVIATQEP